MYDWLTIFTGAVVAMLIGMLWYSPLLFVKPWMALSSNSHESLKKAKVSRPGKTYFAAFVVCVLMSGAVHFFVQTLAMHTVIEAVFIAGMLWLGFIATTLFSGVLWERKPFGLFLINAGHGLAVVVALSLVSYFSSFFIER